MGKTEYAEIEYEFIPDSSVTYKQMEFNRQQIVRKASDPIREKFYAMRSLAAGNPFARRDAGIFYRQAKFMEDFEDRYNGVAYFSMYYPCYQHMGYEQLRTYFSWRTRVRSGEVRHAYASYVYLHIYELLACVGVSEPVDGLDRLLAMWRAFRKTEPRLDDYMPRWLKDFHIVYGLAHSFGEFVGRNGLIGFYPEAFLHSADKEYSFTAWESVSDYSVAKSRFFVDGNGDLYKECFAYALDAVRNLCEQHGVRFETAFSMGENARYHWHPFMRALYYNKPPPNGQTARMPGGEIFYYRDGGWTVNTVVYDVERRELAGYLMKKTEACLRDSVKYKYRLKANPGLFAYEFEKLGVPIAELEKTIERAVADFHRQINRTVVTVDQDNLARIRDEAVKTRDRLIVTVDADINDVDSDVNDVETDENAADTDGSDYNGDNDYGTDENADETDENDGETDKNAGGVGAVRIGSDGLYGDAGFERLSGWDAFFEALSPVERAALELLLGGGADIGAFAAANGVMTEVLADGINEKAADNIGDGILDMGGSPSIYEEYRTDAAAAAARGTRLS